MSHRSSWGAPIWPPTPPIARTRPGAAVARLGLDTGCLIDRRGGPRYGPPHPPSLGRAPAQPWRASGLTQDVSSIVVGGPHIAPPPPPPPAPPPPPPRAAPGWHQDGLFCPPPGGGAPPPPAPPPAPAPPPLPP